MKLDKVFIVGALVLPTTALAQGIVVPSGNMSTTLDPGASPPPPGPPPAPAPAPAPAQPQVYVIGPDGQINKTPGGEPADQGYYIGPDQVPMNVDADVELHAGPIPELHVVRTGDTLWDISYRYFANPWEWPKVWSYNAQITNPHWIYPGDLVRLLPRGLFTAQASDPEQQVQSQKQDPLPAPARRVDVGVRQIAFVEKKDLDTSITVVGSPDEKELLGDGDSVYLSYPADKPPVVGKRYSIYEPGQSVKSGGTEYGSYVRLLGEVEIVSVKQDKRARGLIVRTTREIERGAKVGPLLKTFKNVTPVAPTVDAQAPIVGILTRDQLIGDGEIVFVALGKSSGVAVGNRLFVVRRGDGYPDEMAIDVGKDDRRFPARALGEIVIVDVGDKVSIGLVTLSVQEMAVGDLVMMQKAK